MESLNDGLLVTAASRTRVGVHRSTTTSTVIRPTPVPNSIVTLQGTRQPRHLNEYVDNLATESKRPLRSSSTHSTARKNEQVQIPVSQQPKPIVKPPTAPRDVESDFHVHQDVPIICKHCSKCTCSQCRQKKELPSVWLCHKKCHLSADSVLEACTCLFAVEACFYHASKDQQMDSDVMCADDPCACCSRPHCCKRWLCMATMSLCLPCLWFYWPAKCAIKACTSGYNRCTNNGCKCDSKKGSQNKRLLESDSSSA